MSRELTGQEGYGAFAQELYATNIISDPWIEGKERFRLEPILLMEQEYRRLREAAEAIGRLYDELARIVWENPSLLDDYFHLTPYQKLMWLASEGRWHGIARLDLFILRDGSIRTCEMNSDTPSGEAETVVLNRVRHRFHPETIDPNSGFEERFMAMVMESHGIMHAGDDAEKLSIGILYPTDLPEDLSMIALYRQWFEKRGHRVTLGSPYNLHPARPKGVALFDTPIDILMRHYKTDWWGERIPTWIDEEEYDDPDPLAREIRLLLDADASGELTIVNPFGAVVTQNKLTMAYFWGNIEQFSEDGERTIRSYIPPTFPLRDIDPSSLQKDRWVLKSDYGCEGDEVIVGPMVSVEIWNASLAAAKPERWIAQEYFEIAPIDGHLLPNYGVYLIGGEAAGIFTRLSSHATDYRAVTAPTFVIPEKSTPDSNPKPGIA